jgi:hypothetical protein
MTNGLVAFLTGAAMLVATSAAAQESAPRLRVHPDCNNCFQDYLRNEIRWVDFVRQPQDADIQILSTSRETGGGGTEVTLRFVGLGRFAGITHELRALTIAGETEDVRRRGVLRAVTVGLLNFMARDGLPAHLSLEVASDDEEASRQATRDPWNFWVFSLGTDFQHEAEETSRETSWEFEATADRVTDDWKISLGTSIQEQRERFDLDEDAPREFVSRERRFDWFLAKSLGPHWSFGIEGDTQSSTFENVSFLISAAPAIEFNVFPYEQYATRQLRIGYAVGVQHSRYNEETLFGRFRETRPLQQFAVTLDQRQTWGTLQVGVEWSQYLHDLSKTRLEVDGDLRFRIVRGLSVEVEGSASRIRDQLSLPRRGADPEEILLRLRELQSGYEVSLSVGFSYSFGSIFNNIVNPRFGGGRGGVGGGGGGRGGGGNNN